MQQKYGLLLGNNQVTWLVQIARCILVQSMAVIMVTNPNLLAVTCAADYVICKVFISKDI